MTTLLVVSGCAVTVAHIALRAGNRSRTIRYFILTTFLASLFMLVQVFEYVNLPFSINDGVFGSTFFMATGFHGFHVAVGSIFLIICVARARRDEFFTTQHVGAEAAI
jgi:cytochrome c oxidase subunit 3